MVQFGEKTDVDIRLEALRVAQGDLSKAKEIYKWLSGQIETERSEPSDTISKADFLESRVAILLKDNRDHPYSPDNLLNEWDKIRKAARDYDEK